MVLQTALDMMFDMLAHSKEMATTAIGAVAAM